MIAKLEQLEQLLQKNCQELEDVGNENMTDVEYSKEGESKSQYRQVQGKDRHN